MYYIHPCFYCLGVWLLLSSTRNSDDWNLITMEILKYIIWCYSIYSTCSTITWLLTGITYIIYKVYKISSSDLATYKKYKGLKTHWIDFEANIMTEVVDILESIMKDLSVGRLSNLWVVLLPEYTHLGDTMENRSLGEVSPCSPAPAPPPAPWSPCLHLWWSTGRCRQR